MTSPASHRDYMSVSDQLPIATFTIPFLPLFLLATLLVASKKMQAPPLNAGYYPDKKGMRNLAYLRRKGLIK